MQFKSAPSRLDALACAAISLNYAPRFSICWTFDCYAVADARQRAAHSESFTSPIRVCVNVGVNMRNVSVSIKKSFASAVRNAIITIQQSAGDGKSKRRPQHPEPSQCQASTERSSGAVNLPDGETRGCVGRIDVLTLQFADSKCARECTREKQRIGQLVAVA